MKAIGYLRQSSGESDPEESLSIKVQEEACLKLAAEKGVEVVGFFSDANSTGRSYPTGFEALAAIDTVYQKFAAETGKKGFRKGLGAILERLDEVDCILVMDFTRLIRPLTGSFLENLVMQKLLSSSTKVLSVKEGLLDFSDFQTQLVTGLTSTINSSQLLLQREKAKAGLKKLKEAGEWSSQCSSSFGYRASGRKREVEIVPHRAEIVKMVFKLFLEGKKFFTIARTVAPLLKGDTRAKQLHKSQFLRMLKNPVYCGYYPLEDGTLVKAKCLAGKELVSFSDWSRAQELLGEKKKVNTGSRKNWLPLSGKFFCGYCGSTENAVTTNGDNVHIRCTKHWHQNRPSCRNGLTWKTLEPGGAGLLDALYPLSMVWLVSQLGEARAAQSELIEKLKVELWTCDQKLMKLKDMWVKDLLTQEAFEAGAKELKDKRKKAEAALRESEARAAHGEQMEEARELLAKAFAHTMDEGEAELALRKSISKVTIWRDKIDIELTGGSSFSLPVKKITKSKELPLPWINLECDDGGQTSYEIIYSFSRLSPEAKKKAKTLFEHTSGKLTVKIV